MTIQLASKAWFKILYIQTQGYYNRPQSGFAELGGRDNHI